MEIIKIIGANADLICSDKYYENEEKALDRGVENDRICACCGKEIKDITKAKSIHIIEGGKYLTEDEREFDDGSDLGVFPIGSACYKKYLKNRREITLEV